MELRSEWNAHRNSCRPSPFTRQHPAISVVLSPCVSRLRVLPRCLKSRTLIPIHTQASMNSFQE
jgi:hypothetical protein